MGKMGFAVICTIGLYAPINFWYPGRDRYYKISELYQMFGQLYAKALGNKITRS